MLIWQPRYTTAFFLRPNHVALLRRTGRWPRAVSEPIAEEPGKSWGAVDAALRSGKRGLPDGGSLHRLLGQHGFAQADKRLDVEGPTTMPRKQSLARQRVEKLYEAYLARGQLDPPIDAMCAALAGQVPRHEIESQLYFVRRDKAEEDTPVGMKIRKRMPRWYGLDS
jgi:hypothetical protein